MNLHKRIRNIISGILMMLAAVLMPIDPEIGAIVTILILAFTLIVMGVRYIIFYLSMARHMVGGLWPLIVGVILLDFGMVTLSTQTMPSFYILFYLIVAYAFAGVVDVMNALEAKRYHSSHWRLKLSAGVINLIVAIASIICGVVLRSLSYVVMIYCAGLFYAGIMRIITAFQRTSIVYIQ